MKKWIALLLAGTVSLSALAQDFVGDNRKKVRKGLERYMAHTGVRTTIGETDSTLFLFLRDPQFKPADFIFHFDRRNHCDRALRSACDSCIEKYLKEALANTAYGWVKKNDSTWLSAYSRHLLMERSGEAGARVLTVRRIDWRREDYDRFLAER